MEISPHIYVERLPLFLALVKSLPRTLMRMLLALLPTPALPNVPSSAV